MATETPYVVLLKAFTNLAGKGGRGEWDEIQDCWSFEHLSVGQGGVVLDEDEMPITNSHNIRTSTHTFHIPHQGVCHGLAGYFEAHLFGNVVLSIYPEPSRATKDMMSWFPIFFPFKVSCRKQKGSNAFSFFFFHPYRNRFISHPIQNWMFTFGD